MGIPYLLCPVLCHHLYKWVCLIHMCHVNNSPNRLKAPRLRRAKTQNYLWFLSHIYTGRTEQLPFKEELLTEESFLKILIINTLLICFPCPSRFTTTLRSTVLPLMKMTALTNLSVCGMGQTCKKGLVAGNLPRGPSPCTGPGAMYTKGCNQRAIRIVLRPGRAAP